MAPLRGQQRQIVEGSTCVRVCVCVCVCQGRAHGPAADITDIQEVKVSTQKSLQHHHQKGARCGVHVSHEQDIFSVLGYSPRQHDPVSAALPCLDVEGAALVGVMIIVTSIPIPASYSCLPPARPVTAQQNAPVPSLSKLMLS